MPAIEDFPRVGYAVIWPAVNGRGGNYGEAQTSNPIQLGPEDGTGVRWEPGPRTTHSQSGTVDRILMTGAPLGIGTRCFEGKIADIPDPNAVPELGKVLFYQVVDYQDHLDVKGKNPVHVAYLQRQNSKVAQT